MVSVVAICIYWQTGKRQPYEEKKYVYRNEEECESIIMRGIISCHVPIPMYNATNLDKDFDSNGFGGAGQEKKEHNNK